MSKSLIATKRQARETAYIWTMSTRNDENGNQLPWRLSVTCELPGMVQCMAGERDIACL